MQTLRLGDVCSKIGSGATPRGGSDVYIDNGTALIRSQNVYNDGFHPEGLAFIGEKHAAELQGVEVREGDVLLNITGDSVARVCRAPAAVLPARVNQHVAIIRPDPSILDARFLHYFLASPTKQASMLLLAGGGATRNALTKGMIENFEIPASPIEDQRAIAAVLGALDDKIEQNRRTGRALEALARATFQAWFVDFEPVKAKAAGQTSFPGMPAAAFAALPDRFADSAVGPVPQGWEVTGWGSVVTLEYGKSLRGYQEGEGPYRVFGTNGPIGRHTDRLADGPGIIVGRKGAYRGVHFSPGAFWAIDTAFYVKPKRAIDLKWAYYELLRADINSMDSGSAIPSTSREDFYAIPVCVPTAQLLRAFDIVIGPIFEFRIAAEVEDAKLAALRDYLLPRLLSGRVRVRDAAAGGEEIA